MLRTVERQAFRLQTMMARLNVDAVALIRLERGDVYAKARSLCLVCHESDVCLRWVDQGANGSPDFCPVLEILSACRTTGALKRQAEYEAVGQH